MNFGLFFTFISLLFSTPSDWTNPQAIGGLWQQAMAQPTSSPVGSVTASPQASATPAYVATVPTTAPTPTPIPSDNDAHGMEPAGGDSDGPTASPVQQTATAEPTVAPAATSAAQTSSTTAVSTSDPVAYVSPVPLASPHTTCAGLKQFMVTSFGRLVCTYSDMFTGAQSPLHMTVAQLVAAGATTMPQAMMTNLWKQGYYSQSLGAAPLYASTASDPTVTITCRTFGRCNADGLQIHVPSDVIVQGQGTTGYSDKHLVISDTSIGAEFDGWGCSPPSNGKLKCWWGGWYPFTGKGLADNGSEGEHGGYAYGAVSITAEEILAGHIRHALALDTECLSNPTIYPADPNNGGSDALCGSTTGGSPNNEPNPAPPYGGLVHLKLTPQQIAARGYGYACQVILRALNEYGAYLSDTGNHGLLLVAENSAAYTGTNPWYSVIEPQAVAQGDGNGPSGAGFSWGGPCFGKLTASDFEVLAAPNLGY